MLREVSVCRAILEMVCYVRWFVVKRYSLVMSCWHLMVREYSKVTGVYTRTTNLTRTHTHVHAPTHTRARARAHTHTL